MEDSNSLVFVVIVGSLIVFLLVLLIIVFTVIYNRRIVQKDNELKLSIKNRQLAVLRASIESQTAEREKIAMNLHDEVGPLLSALKLKMFQNQKDFKGGTMQLETFQNDRDFLDNVIKIVRKVSHDLSPSFVTKFGLVKAVENFLAQIEGITTKFEGNFNKGQELPSFVADNLYYIMTELTNNLIKHEKIKMLDVRMELDSNLLTVLMEHDGVGFTQEEFDTYEKSSKGIGLSSIKSRAIVIGGELIFQKTPGSPKIKILTPLSAT